MTHGKEHCCPQLDITLWDKKTHVWKDKPFLTDSIPEFLHIPLPWMFARSVGKMWKKAQDAGATSANKDFILMSYDPSPWKSELYMSVTKAVPGGENVKLSGTFVSKVFDGPYNHVPKWIKEFEALLARQGKSAQKYYFYFTYCLKCAKAYGHNYCVVFAEV